MRFARGHPRGRRMDITAAAFLATLAAASAFPPPAGANPMDAFGLGARGPAMANAQTAEARDFAAVYYNPASMFLVPEGEGLDTFSLTTLGAVDDVYIRNLDGDNIGNPVLNTYHVGMGMADGLGTSWMRAGLNFQLPIFRLQLQRTHFIDEREAFFSNRLSFEFYGDRFQRQIVLPALAFRPHRMIALGVGVSLFTFSMTDTDVYLADLIDQSKAFLNLRGDQRNTNSMSYGALLWPADGWRVGVVYRDSESFAIRGISRVEIEDLPPSAKFSDQLLDFRVQFRPSQAAAGFAWDGLPRTTLAGDLVWSRWSRYRDTHNERPSPRLRDTWTPRLGIEHLWRPRWILRGGYSFEPTPVPPQTGRTNLVDNHKNVFSAGVGFRLPAEGHVVCFDLFGQGHFLVPRTDRKEASRESLQTDALLAQDAVQDSRDNPGYPGFESGGVVYAFGLTMTVGR